MRQLLAIQLTNTSACGRLSSIQPLAPICSAPPGAARIHEMRGEPTHHLHQRASHSGQSTEVKHVSQHHQLFKAVASKGSTRIIRSSITAARRR